MADLDMSSLALLSHLLLWLGFAALLVVNLAVLRQIGVLFERVAPAGALAMNNQISVGDAAPELSLIGLSGAPVSIGGASSDSKLIFFLSPSCAVCSSLLPLVKQLDKQQRNVQVIYASAGEDVQAHERFIDKYGLGRHNYVISDDLGMVLGVSKLPYAVLINPTGHISAFGLVNTREHLESLLEAQRLKVASLQEFIQQQKKSEGERHAKQTA